MSSSSDADESSYEHDDYENGINDRGPPNTGNNDDDSQSETDCREYKESKIPRRKQGRKSQWQNRHINDLVNNMCSDEYSRKTGEIYTKILGQLQVSFRPMKFDC